MRRTLGTVLLLAAAGAALGQDDGARIQLEQRIRLTAQLIGDSPTAQRIVGSGNQRAIAHFDEGRVHHAMAEDLFRRGDLAGARRAVDDALRHVGAARRMVPDAPARQAAVRARYEQALARTDGLIEAWRRRSGSAEVADGDLVAAIGLVATARYFGQEARFEEGMHTLDAAERHLLAGLNRELHAKTLDYTARAGTPAEEFQLELARHQGLAELVPLALSDLRPRDDAVALIERYSETSRTLRAQAQQRFDSGDTKAALASIRSAMLYLQRALGAAGVATPAPTEAAP